MKFFFRGIFISWFGSVKSSHSVYIFIRKTFKFYIHAILNPSTISANKNGLLVCETDVRCDRIFTASTTFFF